MFIKNNSKNLIKTLLLPDWNWLCNPAMKDVIIIGAGPIGLACGIAAKEAGAFIYIFDKGTLVNSLYHYPLNMTFFHLWSLGNRRGSVYFSKSSTYTCRSVGILPPRLFPLGVRSPVVWSHQYFWVPSYRGFFTLFRKGQLSMQTSCDRYGLLWFPLFIECARRNTR